MPSTSDSSSSLPSQSVLIGSSSETSVFGPEGIDGLDQTNGSDGDQVLQIDTGVFKPARDIHDKAKIMLDEQLLGCLVALFQRGDGLPLLLRLQRCGQHVAAADVHDLPRLQKAELL